MAHLAAGRPELHETRALPQDGGQADTVHLRPTGILLIELQGIGERQERAEPVPFIQEPGTIGQACPHELQAAFFRGRFSARFGLLGGAALLLGLGEGIAQPDAVQTQDHRGRDGGQCCRQFRIIAHSLNIRGAEKYPEEAGNERRPCGNECAECG